MLIGLCPYLHCAFSGGIPSTWSPSPFPWSELPAWWGSAAAQKEAYTPGWWCWSGGWAARLWPAGGRCSPCAVGLLEEFPWDWRRWSRCWALELRSDFRLRSLCFPWRTCNWRDSGTRERKEMHNSTLFSLIRSSFVMEINLIYRLSIVSATLLI